MNALRVALGMDLRKIYFRFRQNGTPAGVPFCHFHEKGRNGKLHLQRRFLRKRGAAECVAVCLFSPSREKSVWSAPQTRSLQTQNNYSAEDAQSATRRAFPIIFIQKARRALRTAGFGLQFTLPWSRALPQPWLPALLRGQQRERRASPRASGDWGRPSAGTG